MRTQLFLRIRYFLPGFFPCGLESLHPLVPPGQSGTDPMAIPLGPDWQVHECKGHFGGVKAAARINPLEFNGQSTGALPLHYSECGTQPSPISTLTVLGLTSWLTRAFLVVKYTVLSSQSVFLLVFEVASVVRQSCLLHSTYQWVSQHFVLPVGFFGWVDAKYKLDWTVLRSKIQFHIFRGVPQQSVLPNRYHSDEEIAFPFAMWHWSVEVFKSKINNYSSWHDILLFLAFNEL